VTHAAISCDLIAGWLAQAVLAALLALLLPPLGALLVVVFALALVDTPLAAAVGRCIPAVVADDDLVAANAVRSGVRELGTVLGPPLAGLLFAHIYTKVYDHVLRPLMAPGRPNAPPELAAALDTLDQLTADHITRARVPTAA